MSLSHYPLSGVGIHGLLCALLPVCLVITALPSSTVGEPAEPVAQPASPMLRVVSPVRLPSEPGDRLALQAAAARGVIEKFLDGGFDSTLWVVDALPARDDDIKAWVAGCMGAFPGSVIVALDARLENGKSSLPSERLGLFLAALVSASAPDSPVPQRVATERISILVNYASLNNCACAGSANAAIAAVVQTAKLCRDAAPGVSLWLCLEDCPNASAKIPDWIKAVGEFADGYFLCLAHEWSMASKPVPVEVQGLLKSGKKVLRGGFRYTSPRMRPGLEQDLTEEYTRCIRTYEEWVRNSGYVGYAREIGRGIPAAVDGNLNLLVGQRRQVVGGTIR